METRLYKFVFFVNIILVLYPVRTYSMLPQDKDYRLYNGLQKFEGIVQVSINGSWANVCTTNFTQHAEQFCEDKNPRIYPRNVFGTNEITDAILIDECLSDTGDVNCQPHSSHVINTECEHAAICCVDSNSKNVGCSGDWALVNAVTYITTFKRPSLENVFHLKLKQEETYKKFWTTSAFKEISKSTNNSVPNDDVVKSCLNDCLEKNRPFKRLTIKNETCDFQLTSDSENSRTFEHTENITDVDILLCVVAEINNSQPILTAEDCNNTYRDHRFYYTKFVTPTEPPPAPTASTPTTNATSSKRSDTTIQSIVTKHGHPDVKLSTEETFKLPKWSYYFIGIVSLVLIIIVVIVVCVVHKVRKMNKCSEHAKNNYTANKTYSSRMPLNRQNSGDEYANILDCEMVDLSAGSLKPPLPCREGGEVITLDQYSTPRDTLASNLQDEYSITYDDPIRINQICEKRSQGSANKQSLKKTTSPDTNEIIKEPQNSNTEPQDHCPSITDGKQRVKINTESVETDIDADLKQTDLATSNRESEYEIAVRSSDSSVFRIKGDSGDNNSTSDKSEYEITSLNSEDGTTKPKMFTEHVCLDCLSPEHLKAFGITIVPDDNCYSLCKDVSKRFSAPCTGTNTSAVADAGGTQTVSTSVDDRIVSNSTTENLSCPGASEKCSGQTRCSVCHSVYDRIGKYDRNNWIKYTDNVYQKFGHFHTPRHPFCKRINST